MHYQPLPLYLRPANHESAHISMELFYNISNDSWNRINVWRQSFPRNSMVRCIFHGVFLSSSGMEVLDALDGDTLFEPFVPQRLVWFKLFALCLIVSGCIRHGYLRSKFLRWRNKNTDPEWRLFCGGLRR